MDRRSFVKSAVAAAALAKTVVAASDKVNVAVIGVNGRGKGLAGQFAALPEVNLAYLCDVDERVLGPAADDVVKRGGKRPQTVGDLRRVLDDKSVDAVVIATPDHWHAPATILACDAGKDVYVEKPASHNLREGRLMVEAARRHKRVVQHGTQARSRPSTRRAIEYVKSGKIGRVLMAKAWDVQLRDDIGHREDSAVPPGVDYENWTGPAPMLPFNENRFHYKWHWHWNYGTGDAGNDGVHQIDMARWALGVDYPLGASGMGRKLFFKDDQQTPDTVNLTYDCGDKAIMFEMRIWNPYSMEGVDNGVAIYGSDGMVHIGRWGGKWGYKVFDAKGKEVSFDNANEPDTHAQNFVDCVRSRQAPNAEIEIGHISTVYAHLANIVARTGRNLKFDPKTENIAGDAEAARLLKRQYRKHWATPKESSGV
ncbi:MAG TPA: Gfo/Idh/MocA family oxidoreductase [Blastocatellia bacterium]|nr:Gfo/Idh/MocA family oxidoreductase [Blastocatellia bacterium]